MLGEVLRPSTQTLPGNRLTLNEALSDSGGVNPVSADPRQIYVIRAQQPTQPQIFHLDAKSPVAYALAEGFELQARDVVYVDPVPLVRWNRVISLIVPQRAGPSPPARRRQVNPPCKAHPHAVHREHLPQPAGRALLARELPLRTGSGRWPGWRPWSAGRRTPARCRSRRNRDLTCHAIARNRSAASCASRPT